MESSGFCKRCGAGPDSLGSRGLCASCLPSLDDPGPDGGGRLPSAEGTTRIDPSDDADDGLTRVPTAPGADDLGFQTSDLPGEHAHLGDFQILEELARGGMGIVYKARQRSLDRVVALKLILAGKLASDRDIERFRTEAEATARLDHPGIVPVFEVGRGDGLHYLVMPFVTGSNLSTALAPGPWPPIQAAAIVRQLAEAIQHAHDSGIVHRDLKPANILIDDRGRPRITDFGLARRLGRDGHLSGPGQIMGTAGFMAPEQASGRDDEVGPPADVYALGSVLYTIVTGRPPFQSANPVDTLRQVIEEPPARPRDLNAAVPLDLEIVCLKCLEKDPSRRYESAEALADDLSRFLDKRPIQARSIGRLGRGLRWCHRQPSAACALALSAVLLATAVAVPVAVAVRETAAARRLADAHNHIADAQRSTLRALGDARRRAASSTLDRALILAERGEVARGLIWLGESLESATQAGADASELVDAIRLEISAWSREVHALRRIILVPSPPERIAFAPDGRLLAASGRDGVVRLWDPETGTRREAEFPHVHPVASLAFEGGGASLRTVDADGKARLWDIASGRLIHSGAARPVALVEGPPEPARPAILRIEQTPPSVLEALPPPETSAGPALGSVLEHLKSVEVTAFSPDGRRIATASRDRTARIWNAATWSPIGSVLHHPDQVLDVAFGPDNRVIVTGCADGALRIWGLASDRRVRTLGHGRAITAAVISPDGRTAATGSEGPGGGSIVLTWDVATGEPGGRVFTLDGPIAGLAFGPDGAVLLAADRADGIVTAWDLAGGEILRTFGPGAGEILAIDLDPSGTVLATGGVTPPGPETRGVAQTWDLDSGRALSEPLAHPGPVRGLAFLGFSGDSILTGGDDRAVFHWSLDDPTSSDLVLLPGGEVLCVARSADGQRIGTGLARGTARIWRAGTWEPSGIQLVHSGGVASMAFSLDGQLALTGSLDQTARFWHAQTGRPVGPALRHDGPVRVVACSPDGQLALTAGEDGQAHLWALPDPLPGDFDLIQDRVERETGLRLDEHGSFRVLEAAAWLDRHGDAD